jgi:hypothetical protein
MTIGFSYGTDYALRQILIGALVKYNDQLENITTLVSMPVRIITSPLSFFLNSFAYSCARMHGEASSPFDEVPDFVALSRAAIARSVAAF